MSKIFSKEFKLTLIAVLYLVSIYFLLSVCFYFINYSLLRNLDFKDVIFSLLYGIRFDLAGIFYSNIVLFVLFNLPLPISSKKWFKFLFLVLFIVVNLFVFTFCFIDFGYFASTQRRLSFELFTMLPDILRSVPSTIRYHFLLLIFFIIFVVIYIYGTIKVFILIDNKLIYKKSYIIKIINFILLIFISVVAIRGGFQLKPIRQADAFISDKTEAGILSMNTTFDVIRSLTQQDINEINVINAEVANKTVQSFLKSGNEVFLDNNYPFLRTIHREGEPEKLNVVIFIMESWSSKFCGCITGGKTFTPFFDSIASSGTLFTKFFANGQRSIEGIPSIITSVPSLSNASIINSNAEMSRFRGLGSILQEQGYVTNFHHGAKTGSMGFDKFTRLSGFSNYFGKESFNDTSGNAYDGVWGIYDEPFFSETANQMKNFDKPFCSVIFSLSSHDPFHFPENRKDFFTPFSEETDLEKGIRYSDLSLRRFFSEISNEDWFKNTVFLITADHTLYNTRDDFKSTYQVPLLIYIPKYPDKKINTKAASQSDILPTILDLLKINTVHSSMGSSVLDPNTGNYAFVKFNSFYCVISESYVLLNNLETKPTLYNYSIDTNLKNNISDLNPEITNDLNLKLLSYLQLSTHAISKDKIYKRN